MGKGDTKQRILDSAEMLFARDGYKETSLRSITSHARVNLAAVNYHFGSKLALLEAVLKRRLQPLNKIRRQRIEEVRDLARKEGTRPGVKAVLQAFIEPTLRFKESEPDSRYFISLIGRSFAEHDDTIRKLFLRNIKTIFELLLQTMREALPELSHDVLFWRLQFAMGAFAHTMRIWDSDMFEPMQINTKIDVESLLNLLVPYIASGMELP